jgi:hypothetical protein
METFLSIAIGFFVGYGVVSFIRDTIRLFVK